MRTRSRAILLLTAIFSLALFLSQASACEGCANLEATSTGQSVRAVQAGFSWSVIFLLGVPFALMIGFVRLMVKACRQADQRH